MVVPVSCKWRLKSPGDGGQLRLTRRTLLASCLASIAAAQKSEVSSFDLSLVDEGTTPNQVFFVRHHFGEPTVAPGGKLAIRGAVASLLEMSIDDLSGQPQKTLPVTLECAENPVGGGLVSHAEWSGVSLASLLEKAQPRPEARFVRMTGADGYVRTISLAKASEPNTLIAFRMNGEKLPPAHGLPARAIVSGWYGMDSVKWLQRIDLLEHEDTQTPAAFSYRRQVKSLLAGARETDPVTAMNVKSAFSRPVDGAFLTGRRFVVRGVAWAGEQRIRKVELSTDGGKKWHDAKASQSQPYAWSHWEYAWTIPAAGEYELIVRATDASGRTQPSERAGDRADGYELNAWQTIRVIVA